MLYPRKNTFGYFGQVTLTRQGTCEALRGRAVTGVCEWAPIISEQLICSWYV